MIGLGKMRNLNSLLDEPCSQNASDQIFHPVAHMSPVRLLWNLKAVVFREGRIVYVTLRFLQRMLELFIIYITDALKEGGVRSSGTISNAKDDMFTQYHFD